MALAYGKSSSAWVTLNAVASGAAGRANVGLCPAAIVVIENERAQCRFPGLASSNARILIHFSNQIYGSIVIKQHSETVVV